MEQQNAPRRSERISKKDYTMDYSYAFKTINFGRFRKFKVNKKKTQKELIVNLYRMNLNQKMIVKRQSLKREKKKTSQYFYCDFDLSDSDSDFSIETPIKSKSMIIGRETEFEVIYSFITKRIQDGLSGCLYISGVPGSGKTSTVCQVLKKLDRGNINPININCLNLMEPKQIYREVSKNLKNCSKNDQETIQAYFETSTSKTVLVLDEFDKLVTSKMEVLYTVLEWQNRGNVILIAISNAFNLPETLSNKISSRIGLTRLNFRPYHHNDLKQILLNTLPNSKRITSDGLELITRKVASISGDARTALSLTRRILHTQSKGCIHADDVDRIIGTMFLDPKIMALSRASRLEKILIQSITAQCDRTGNPQQSMQDIMGTFKTLCVLQGVKIPSGSLICAILQRLCDSKLIYGSDQCGIERLLTLNLSSDDVYFALHSI